MDYTLIEFITQLFKNDMCTCTYFMVLKTGFYRVLQASYMLLQLTWATRNHVTFIYLCYFLCGSVKC